MELASAPQNTTAKTKDEEDDIKISFKSSYPSPPLCHLSTRPSGGSLRDGKKRVCLMRRSPQLHGASASPAFRHAAIHRLITIKEKKQRMGEELKVANVEL
ncbi:hypothetical protein PAMP_008036 [Pampus punctatissimus]